MHLWGRGSVFCVVHLEGKGDKVNSLGDCSMEPRLESACGEWPVFLELNTLLLTVFWLVKPASSPSVAHYISLDRHSSFLQQLPLGLFSHSPPASFYLCLCSQRDTRHQLSIPCGTILAGLSALSFSNQIPSPAGYDMAALKEGQGAHALRAAQGEATIHYWWYFQVT